jgi:hypothetical protein
MVVQPNLAYLGDSAKMPPDPPPFEFAPDASIPPSVWASASGWNSAWRLANTWSAVRFLMWRRSSPASHRCRTSSTAWRRRSTWWSEIPNSEE